MTKLTPEQFVRIWQTSKSVTEASMRLQKLGHEDLDANHTVALAWGLKRLGVEVKDPPWSELPDFQDPDRDLAVKPVEAVKSEPETVEQKVDRRCLVIPAGNNNETFERVVLMAVAEWLTNHPDYQWSSDGPLAQLIQACVPRSRNYLVHFVGHGSPLSPLFKY